MLPEHPNFAGKLPVSRSCPEWYCRYNHARRTTGTIRRHPRSDPDPPTAICPAPALAAADPRGTYPPTPNEPLHLREVDDRDRRTTPQDNRTARTNTVLHQAFYSLPQSGALVAQGIEHRSPKAGVAGSNPAEGTENCWSRRFGIQVTESQMAAGYAVRTHCFRQFSWSAFTPVPPNLDGINPLTSAILSPTSGTRASPTVDVGMGSDHRPPG